LKKNKSPTVSTTFPPLHHVTHNGHIYTLQSLLHCTIHLSLSLSEHSQILPLSLLSCVINGTRENRLEKSRMELHCWWTLRTPQRTQVCWLLVPQSQHQQQQWWWSLVLQTWWVNPQLGLSNYAFFSIGSCSFIDFVVVDWIFLNWVC